MESCHTCSNIYKNQSPKDWVVCPKMPANVLIENTGYCEHYREVDWVQCDCGHWFIYDHELGAPTPSCPKCGSKQYSTPEIIFKGPGFYVNESD